MIKKVLIPLAFGLFGAAISVGAFAMKPYMKGIWKNIENTSIFVFVFCGFVIGSLLAFLWLKDKETGK